jgi:hypothetical protein
MNRKIIFIIVVSLISILLVDCGPSQAELDVTATKMAFDIFSTQTAQAPTATETFTETPVPTETEIPTATSPPTDTPAPTETSTITPTAPPELMAAALTIDDLPTGFVEMSPEELGVGEQSFPEGTYVFGFSDEINAQLILGFIIPVTNRADQAAYDAMLPQMIEAMAIGMGAGPDFQEIPGLDDIGETRSGITSLGQMGSLSMRYDIVGFRRGEVVAILVVGRPDSDEPTLPMSELTKLMDGRIMEYSGFENLGGGGMIAFSSNRDGDFEIYTINADGTDLTRLTHQFTDDLNPEFSPDGEIIIFWAMEAHPLISEFQFIGVDGEHMGTFAPGLEYASWSPDSNAVVYVASNGPENFEIMKGVFGQMTEPLTTDPTSDHMPAWSPDGKTIAFVAHRDGLPKIYLMNSDGTQQRSILATEMMGIDPAWSPDGTKLAFSSGDDTSTQIYIMNLDGTEITQLTDSPGYNEHPTWSPDGTMIAFWSNRSGNSEIYKINIDGSGLINLTNDPAEDENPSWSK